MKSIACLTSAIAIFLFSCNDNDSSSAYNGWGKAHGNSDGNHYSSLTQIDTSNVQQLQVAWTFHTGDADTAAHSNSMQSHYCKWNNVLHISPVKTFCH